MLLWAWPEWPSPPGEAQGLGGLAAPGESGAGDFPFPGARVLVAGWTRHRAAGATRNLCAADQGRVQPAQPAFLGQARRLPRGLQQLPRPHSSRARREALTAQEAAGLSDAARPPAPATPTPAHAAGEPRLSLSAGRWRAGPARTRLLPARRWATFCSPRKEVGRAAGREAPPDGRVDGQGQGQKGGAGSLALAPAPSLPPLPSPSRWPPVQLTSQRAAAAAAARPPGRSRRRRRRSASRRQHRQPPRGARPLARLSVRRPLARAGRALFLGAPQRGRRARGRAGRCPARRRA